VKRVGAPTASPLPPESYASKEKNPMSIFPTKILLATDGSEIEDAGVGVAKSHLTVGHPAEEIVAYAQDEGAGLIVMGSRGKGGIRRSLTGRVSDSVVRHAHCPVLVVRHENE
jgi:hypothetical protein